MQINLMPLQTIPVAYGKPPRRFQETGEVAGEVTGGVTGEVRSLLRVLRDEMGRAEIQSEIGLKSQANFRERYLEPALNWGLVEMTIPDKPTSRLQKYRLTEKGRQIKKDLIGE